MFTINDLQLPPPKDWNQFESLVCDLYASHWSDPSAQRNGRLGQGQKGVDVFGTMAARKGWLGVQCKNKNLLLNKLLTEEELEEAVRLARQFDPPLRELTIATTGPRDAKLQERARLLSDVHQKKGGLRVTVASWDDLTELLGKYPAVAKRYYGALFLQVAPRELAAEGTIFTANPKSRNFISERSAKLQQILPATAYHALGIIATSLVPWPLSDYAKLFKSIDWAAAVAKLEEVDAIMVQDDKLVVNDIARASFVPSTASEKPFVDLWVSELTPLKNHSDMAFILSTFLAKTGKLIEGIELLIETGLNLEAGSWNDTFADVLCTLNNEKLHSLLSKRQLVSFFDSLGNCSLRAGRHETARDVAEQMRLLSRALKDHNSLCNSYILSGLAAEKAGDRKLSVLMLRRAVNCAKQHGIAAKLGEAQHELALALIEVDLVEAQNMLKESIQAKKKARDSFGLIHSMFASGLIAAGFQDDRSALKWFKSAERAADKAQLVHMRVTSLCNMGTAQLNLGKFSSAMRYFSLAADISKIEGYQDTLILALNGTAKSCLELKQHLAAKACFEELQAIHSERAEVEEILEYQNNAAVCVLNDGRGDEARKAFADVYNEAINRNSEIWIRTTAYNIAISWLHENKPERTIEEFRAAAQREAAAARHGISAYLWFALAARIKDINPDSRDLEAVFQRALEQCQSVSNFEHHEFNALSGLYEFYSRHGMAEKAIETLEYVIALGRKSKDPTIASRGNDQFGVLLQELNRPKEAIRKHNAALKLARANEDLELIESCLNNLAEAYRKTRKFRAAFPLYHEAERLAHKRKDFEDEITIAHNRALALSDSGKTTQAKKVLRSCRDRARRNGYQYQYVRALHGLANLEWATGSHASAVTNYATAFRASKKYKLSVLTFEIAINYAHALRFVDRSKTAIRALLSVSKHALSNPDAHLYYWQLGAAFLEIGDDSAAKGALKIALELATRDLDCDTILAFLRDYVQLLSTRDEAGIAVKQIRDLLDADHSPSDRNQLTVCLLIALIKGKRHKQANVVFGEIQNSSRKHKLYQDLVDAYMFVGDHEWYEGTSKTNAMKAYIAALTSAAHISTDELFRIGAYSLQRLLSLPDNEHLKAVQRIYQRIEEWFLPQVPKELRSHFQAFSLWPFRIATQMISDPDSKTWSSDLAMGKLLYNETIGFHAS